MEQSLIYILAATVVAAAVTLVAKIVFDWLKGRRDGDLAAALEGIKEELAALRAKDNPGAEMLADIKADVAWIREIHDQRDPNGMPLWYVPRAWKKELDEIGDAVKKSNSLLEQILSEVKK